MWLYHRVMSLNNKDGMANSVDPDQTAPLGAVWSGSALFAQANLSRKLWLITVLLTALTFSNYLQIYTSPSTHQPHDLKSQIYLNTHNSTPSMLLDLLNIFTKIYESEWIVNHIPWVLTVKGLRYLNASLILMSDNKSFQIKQKNLGRLNFYYIHIL